MKPLSLRLLRYASLAVIGLLTISVVVLAGIVFYLRSPEGEAYAMETLVAVLHDKGIDIDIRQFEGPLPFRVRFQGVRLSDEDGVWLEGGAAEARLDLTGLLFGNVEVSSLVLSEAELFRLPSLTVDETEKTSSPSETPIIPSLAIGIDVRRFDVRKVVIGEAVAGVRTTVDMDGGVRVQGGRLSGTVNATFDRLEVGRGTLQLNFDTPRRSERTKVRFYVDAHPGTELPEAFRVAAGERFHLEGEGLIPGDLSPYGLYTFEALMMETAHWRAEVKEAALQQRSAEEVRFESGFHFVVKDGQAFDTLFSLPFQRAEATGFLQLETKAEGEKLFSLRGEGKTATPAVTALDFDMAGKVRWNGETMPEIDSLASMTMQGDMPWLPAEIAALAGRKIVLNTSLAGEGGRYDLSVGTFEMEHASAHGEIRVAFDGTRPDEFAKNPGQALKDAHLAADIAVKLDEIAHLPLEGTGVSGGPFDMRVWMNGTGQAPVFNAIAMAPSLEAPEVSISGLVGFADATLSGLWEGEPDDFRLQGQAGVFAGNALGSSSFASVAWNVTPDEIVLSDMKSALGGILIQAGEATFSMQEGSGPVVDGSIKGRIENWHTVTALSGSALEGAAADFEIAAHPEDGAQGIGLRLAAPHLAVRERENLIRVDELSVTAAIRDPFGFPRADVKISATRGETNGLRLSKADVSLAGGVEEGNFAVTVGSPSLRLNGEYSLDQPMDESRVYPHEIRLADVRLVIPEKNISLRTLSATRLGFGRGIGVEGLDLAVGPSGTLKGSALIGEQGASVDLQANRLPFSLLSLVSGDISKDTIPNGTLTFNGGLKTENGEASGTFTASASMVVPEVTPERTAALNLEGTLTSSSFNGQGNLSLSGTQRQGRNINNGQLIFDLPLKVSEQGYPVLDDQAPLKADFNWQGPVEQLWALVPLADRHLTGAGQLSAVVSGTLQNPQADLSASLKGGRYVDRVYGVVLDDISLDTQQRSDGTVEASLSLADGRGGNGRIQATLDNPFMPTARPRQGGARLEARGEVNRLSPLHRDDLSLTFSGPFSAEGGLFAPRITADLRIEKGELRLLDTLGGGVTTLEVVDSRDIHEELSVPKETEMEMALHISVPNQFFIRGRGLDSEWKGDFMVEGSLLDPVLKGKLEPVRGQFDLLSRPFSFSGGSITFVGNTPPDPLLNVEMTHRSPSLIAIVRAVGFSSRPALELDSQPSLPKDEIMAQVLFGKDASSLSHFEALQVANGLRQLAGIGENGLDPLASVRDTLGIDVLRLGSPTTSTGARLRSDDDMTTTQNSDALDGVSLEAGKYVMDNVYVGVEQGTTEGSTRVRVEIELRPNLTLEGRTSGNSSEVGIGWKRDY